MKRGVTLIELLVVLVISGIIGLAVSRAWAAGVTYQLQAPEARARAGAVMRFEERLRDLISNAYLSSVATDTTTYFIGAAAEGAQANVANSIVFTTAGTRLNGAYLAETDTDLQTLNEKYGPQGGPVEVSLSTIPVGNAPEQNGLFLREQRPADGDNSQGGMESVLDPGVVDITFEFFDGTTWLTDWSTESGQRRLPAAVRVTYSLDSEDESRILLISLKNSDVTPDNPVVAGGDGA